MRAAAAPLRRAAAAAAGRQLQQRAAAAAAAAAEPLQTAAEPPTAGGYWVTDAPRWVAAPPTLPSRDEWYGKEAGSAVAIAPATDGQPQHHDLPQLRAARAKDIAALPEVQQATLFAEQLQQGDLEVPAEFAEWDLERAGMTPEQLRELVRGGMATALLHVEARTAALLGLGFYTIGPGGEELTGAAGLALRDTDAMALHYRHTAAQVCRQFKAGRDLDEVLLDRARGHAVSASDPVTGGHHCAIGGGPYDFLVTSTLASQAPQAVGRALGNTLAHTLGVQSRLPSDSVNFVSVGDGSVNHAQYLTSLNQAEYAAFRRFRCPVVFAVSDNGIAISLRGHNWLEGEFLKKLRMPVYGADGGNALEMWKATRDAVEYSRKRRRPSFLLWRNVPRRFGHAATDRQLAYMTKEEVERERARNPLRTACAQAVREGVATPGELAAMWGDLWERTRRAFDVAVNEPKVTSRDAVLGFTAQPLPSETRSAAGYVRRHDPEAVRAAAPKDRHVMRKRMTQVFAEALEEDPSVVYIGEDCEHGGYYLVTEGLAQRFPGRVRDFPPEETALMGAAIGYAQVGLTPIVEIPYAKYLDCGADQFFEAALMNWLSAGKQPNGMVIRLQGFDRGVFGGNFHTHNTLHLPPGLDVVCFSNGPDYQRGMRRALQMARKGRVVMSVDCTALLNARHVMEGDGLWEMPAAPAGEEGSFDEVTVHGSGTRLAIVTYGNGVVTALQARDVLLRNGVEGVVVVDAPLLSRTPKGLEEVLRGECPWRQHAHGIERVVFADICKFGQHPLGATVCNLQSKGLLPGSYWEVVAAQPTYNPLGTYLTFLNAQDVVDACARVLSR
eukprot:TRINITY_DN8045_c10_g1_i1.p1 TRINITY_DN8045_c10_g1~~TRINITY_DN8045_c10_g1_i1.p1  ORF type:complete len:839 (+),score=252.98 TRINITY_DN8045_c10_g1_i1:73-2589(+)